jgi:hypothetical protein
MIFILTEKLLDVGVNKKNFVYLLNPNNNNMEQWKKIKDYEDFEVSDLGRIRKKNMIYKPQNNGRNYLGVGLRKNGVKKRYYVHRLVAAAFIENPENKSEVNHIDGNRMNNNLLNLEWVTRSENHYHRYKVLGQRGVNFGKTGSKNWNSKMVGMFDKDNNLIDKFHGVMEASRILNVNESSIRFSIYRGGNCKGYKWKYL